VYIFELIKNLTLVLYNDIKVKKEKEKESVEEHMLHEPEQTSW
jgi:hypothetical protein